MRAIAAIAAACFLFFLSEAAPQEQQWLFYSPAISRLQGKLTKVTKYGKPTYGENPEVDEKIEVPILILRTPIRVKQATPSSTNDDSLTNVTFVQLIFPADAGDYSKNLDRDIIVEGMLQKSREPNHFTNVVMVVKAMNPTEKPVY